MGDALTAVARRKRRQWSTSGPLGLLSERQLTKQMGVAWIGSAVILSLAQGPTEGTDTEDENDRESRENADRGENVDGLNTLKHGQPPRTSLHGL